MRDVEFLKYIAAGDARAILFFNTFTNNFKNNNGKNIDSGKARYLLDARNYIDNKKKDYSEYDIHPELVDFIINMGITHRTFENNTGKTLDNLYTADGHVGKGKTFVPIVENVYANWSKIDKNVKDFYKMYFDFVDLTGGVKKTIDDKEYEQKANELKNDNTKVKFSYNIEFKKVKYSVMEEGGGVYASADIDVPKIIDLIPEISFSVPLGRIFAWEKFNKYIEADVASDNDLKSIYAFAYLKDNTDFLPKNQAGGENDSKEFENILRLGNDGIKKDLGVATVKLGDRLKVTGINLEDGYRFLPKTRTDTKLDYLTRGEEKEKEEQIQLSKDLCEQMIIDMGVSTGKIWDIDENGKRFHLKDGKKIYEKDLALEVCTDGASCKNFVNQCLLRGNECDSEFAKELLNLEWKGQKIFENGKFNVDLFPPILLVNILYVLGFPYKTLGETNYVQSYEFWKKNIFPKFEKDADKKWIFDFFTNNGDDSNVAKLLKKIVDFINVNKVILNPKLKRETGDFAQKPSSYYPTFKETTKSPIVFMYGGYDKSIYNYSYIDPFQYQLGVSFIQPNGSLLKDHGQSGSNFLKRQWNNVLNLAKKNGTTITNKNQIDQELSLLAALEKDVKQQISYTHEYVRLTKDTLRGKDLKRDEVSTRDIPDLKKEITMSLGELNKKETNLAKLIANSLNELGVVMGEKEDSVVQNPLSKIVKTGW